MSAKRDSFVSAATITLDASPSEVYDLLSDLSTWPSWRRNPFSGCLLGAVTAGGRDKLGVGDRFGTMSAPAALGVVPLPVRQQVTRADGRSRLEWEDDAVWGLAAGKRSFRLERGRTEVVAAAREEEEEQEKRKKGWFFSLGGGKGNGSSGSGGGSSSRRQERTKVTVEHEREHGGLPALLAPAFAMERANARWLLDLKKAVESSKRKQEDEARKKQKGKKK